MSIINNCIIQRHTQKINLFTSSPSPQPPQQKNVMADIVGWKGFLLCVLLPFLYILSLVCVIFIFFIIFYLIYFSKILFFLPEFA